MFMAFRFRCCVLFAILPLPGEEKQHESNFCRRSQHEACVSLKLQMNGLIGLKSRTSLVLTLRQCGLWARLLKFCSSS